MPERQRTQPPAGTALLRGQSGGPLIEISAAALAQEACQEASMSFNFTQYNGTVKSDR